MNIRLEPVLMSTEESESVSASGAEETLNRQGDEGPTGPDPSSRSRESLEDDGDVGMEVEDARI